MTQASFRNEGAGYVPMFFAAAIIGENPRNFGLQMQPLSNLTGVSDLITRPGTKPGPSQQALQCFTKSDPVFRSDDGETVSTRELIVFIACSAERMPETRILNSSALLAL